jgi:hypothetical protein
VKSKTNRRSFIASGVAVAGVELATNTGAYSQVPSSIFNRQYRFAILPNTFVRLNEDGSIRATNPWRISDDVPGLRGKRKSPDAAGASPVDIHDCRCAPVNTPEGDPFAPLPTPSLHLLGEFPTAELVGEITQALTLGQAIDVELIFDDQSNTGNGPDSGSLSGPTHLAPNYYIQDVNAFGYKLQFRGPDYSGFMPCAPEAPKHYHIEMYRQNPFTPKRYDYIFNLHLAAWRSGGSYCFAIANEKGWPPCTKKCTPTWSDIYQSFLASFLAIGITYFVAATLANLMAGVVYGSLGLLAL